MMVDEEIKSQAMQFLEGPLEKGIDFDEWADSKDFAPADRQAIHSQVISKYPTAGFDRALSVREHDWKQRA